MAEERNVNVVVKLIERMMEADGWGAYSPDSYAGYLFRLTDEQIREAIDEETP